jgi:3-hydroxyisobutyrate dehydrogenase-like beta-hydroxyacid dehydrogenase
MPLQETLKLGYIGLGSQGHGMAMMIERAGWPLLQIHGSSVSYLREIVSGQRCKLINNMLFIANIR